MTDSKNGPGTVPIDPTKNVLDTLSAAVRRLDDLDQAEKVRNQDLHLAESRRVDEQIAANERWTQSEITHLKETAALRSFYEERLTIAEAKRIDANRAGDAAAVAVASERATAQAAVLANQLVATSETSRVAVSQTAATMAAAVEKFSAQIMDRVTLLERQSARGEGKASYTDPAIAELAEEMRALRMSGAIGTGKGQGMNALWGYIVGGFGLLAIMLSVFSILMRMKP
jgi:hypothetical protein